MAAPRRCPNGHEWLEIAGSVGDPCPICGAAIGAETAVTVEVPTRDLPPNRLTVWDVSASVPALPTIPVPGYELLGELGRGGMGVVFRARQVKLNRIVALKMVLSGELASTVELDRFRAEAEAAARLQHPNIVQLYEFGEVRSGDGTPLPYFALEYVNGGSLADRLDGTPQPARSSAEMIESLARAMHYAHTQGVIHRDLKPGNVLLSGEAAGSSGGDETSRISTSPRPHHLSNIPKITDFGLAKRMDSATGHTQSGAILGTPQYMAPEQAAGKSKRVGPGTDIYALGAMLYELITGRPPFQGETPLEIILQVNRDEPLPPRLLNPGVPRDLETITLKCLQKDPGRRYDSAQALADDLLRFLDDQPITARPAGPIERTRAWIRRHPTVSTLLAVTLVSVTALLALAYHSHRVLQAAYDDSHRRLVDVTVANGARRADDGDLPLALPWYVEAMKLDHEYPSRAAVHRMRFAAAHEPCPDLIAAWDHRGRVADIAFRFDSRAAATAGEDGTINEWNLDQPNAKPLRAAHVDGVSQIAYAPNDVRLLIVGGTNVYIRNRTGEPLLALPHPAIVNRAAWTPDGKHVLSASADGIVRTRDADVGKMVGPELHHGHDIRVIAISMDGSRAATGATDDAVCVWDLTTGKEVSSPMVVGAQLKVVAFNPDGQLLLIAAGRTARLWDVATAQPKSKELTYRQELTDAALSADGLLVATVSADGTGGVWNSKKEEWADESIKHNSGILAVTFSKDGNWVASAGDDNTARVWDTRHGSPRTPRLPHAGTVGKVAFSPDGHWLLTASDDGLAKLWKLRDAKATEIPAPLPLAKPGPVFSRDGSLCITPDGRSAQVTNAESHAPLSPLLNQDGPITRVAFSPDGTRVATASSDRTAILWDWRSGTRVGTPLRHGSKVNDVVFSPDGRRVATGSDDNTVRVWNAVTSEPLTPPLPLSGSVYNVRFSPDGRLLLAVGNGPYARVWDTAGGEAIAVVLRDTTWVAAALKDVNSTAEWKLPTTSKSDEQLQDIAEWLSGHQIDKTGGGLVPLDGRKLQEIGERVRGQ